MFELLLVQGMSFIFPAIVCRRTYSGFKKVEIGRTLVLGSWNIIFVVEVQSKPLNRRECVRSLIKSG